MSQPFARNSGVTAVDVWHAGRQWLGEGRGVALATVVSTWGSSPVAVGGQMVIADDERFVGSVSGGCVETEVIIAATELIATGGRRVVSFGVAHETAWEAGLPCGGEVKVYVERLDPGEGLALLDAAIDARTSRRGLLVKTDLGDGRRTVLTEDRAEGPDDIARLRSGRSGLVVEEGREVFHHALVPGPHVVIIGATQIARALVEMCRLTEFDVRIIDPRESYASEHRFGGVERVVAWPREAFEGAPPDAYTAVVALSHVAEIDDDALVSALGTDCAYVGALGSVRNHARRRTRLQAVGVSDDKFSQIHCPVGIDIGAHTPAEIAVSIMAEIVLAFRGRRRS